LLKLNCFQLSIFSSKVSPYLDSGSFISLSNREEEDV